MLLRERGYPYENLHDWKTFHEMLLPSKKDFYSNRNMEHITDVEYRRAKRVFENFNNKNLGDYYYLYVQSHTLLLADVFQNFRNKCIEI